VRQCGRKPAWLRRGGSEPWHEAPWVPPSPRCRVRRLFMTAIPERDDEQELGQVTCLLREVDEGPRALSNGSAPRLRRAPRPGDHAFRRQNPDHSLQPTAIVLDSVPHSGARSPADNPRGPLAVSLAWCRHFQTSRECSESASVSKRRHHSRSPTLGPRGLLTGPLAVRGETAFVQEWRIAVRGGLRERSRIGGFSEAFADRYGPRGAIPGRNEFHHGLLGVRRTLRA